jgi:hypothetical protein
VTNAELKLILKLKDLATKQFEKNMYKIQKTAKRVMANIKKYWLAYAAVVAAAVLAIKKFSGALINTASTVEDLRVRLETLLGSVSEGNRVFESMSELASKVPKTYEEIMESATDLSAVVRGGSDEIEKLMPIIVDISAGTGIAVKDVTSQMIRMYSAGASAADMFRERGVLAALGFQAGVSYSAEETMNQITKAWEDGTAKYIGASKRLATTWTGLMSMMQDAWFNFKKDIGKDLFSKLKSDMQAIYHIIVNSKEEGGKYTEIVNELNEAIGEAYESFKEFLAAMIIGAGEVVDAWRKVKKVYFNIAIWANKAALAVIKLQQAQSKLLGYGWLPHVKNQYKGMAEQLEFTINELEKGLETSKEVASESMAAKIRTAINDFKQAISVAKTEIDQSAQIGQGEQAGIEGQLPGQVGGEANAGLSPADQLALEKEWSTIKKQMQQEDTEFLLAELEERRIAFERLGADKVTLDKWYQGEHTKILKAQTDAEIASAKARFEAQKTFASNVASIMRSAAQLTGNSWLDIAAIMIEGFAQAATAILHIQEAMGAATFQFWKVAAAVSGLVAIGMSTATAIANLSTQKTKLTEATVGDLPGAATGMDYVPDTMPILVHRGERIQRADENPYNPGSRASKKETKRTVILKNYFSGNIYTSQKIDNIDEIMDAIGNKLNNAIRSYA